MKEPMDNQPFSCPSEAEIRAILAADSGFETRPELLRHLDACADCQAAMDRILGTKTLDEVAHGEPSEIAALKVDPSLVSKFDGNEGSECFEILEIVDQGGEGVVYRAIEKASGETVALKRLRFVNYGDPGSVAREITAARKLDHPGIVKLYRHFEWAGHTTLVMEWVEGGNLRDRLKRQELTSEESADLVMLLCEILEYAHAQGLVHRDLKPSNILLEGGRIESPRLSDFGQVKFEGPDGNFSAVTSGIGTPGYMAPEMISSDFGPVSPATDIYSLGVILHEMLTGQLPFDCRSHFDFMRQTCDESVTSLRHLRPKLSKDLETICLKCLSKRQSDRYPDMASLKADMLRFRSGIPVEARRPGMSEHLKAFACRNPALTASLAGLFLILLSSVVALSVLLERSRVSQKTAEDSKAAADDSRVLAENLRGQAEGSLKLAVDSMQNAAPIFKRFVQNAIPNEGERRNLLETADICLQIGDDTTDLRVRSESYFNALQMASAIAILATKDENKTKLLDRSEQITRYTLEKLNGLKLNFETQLRATPRGNPSSRISEYDKINIRIGYCLIELCQILDKRGPQFEPKRDEYLDQAIQQTRRTLEENAELAEAMEMLANFLGGRYIRNLSRGKSQEALADIRDSLRMLQLLYDEERDNVRRATNFMGAWFRYHSLLELLEPESPELIVAADDSLGRIRQLLSDRPGNYEQIALHFFGSMSGLIFERQSLIGTESARKVVDEFLAQLDRSREIVSQDTEMRHNLNSVWLEQIGQLVLLGNRADARHQCQAQLAWLKDLGNAVNADLLLCRFLLICPLPEFRNVDEAGRILDQRLDPDPMIDDLRMHFENARGSGKAHDLISSTKLNSPVEIQDRVRLALLDLANRNIETWAQGDRATFEKIRNLMHNKSQFRSYDICLLREVEERLKSRDSTKSAVPGQSNQNDCR